MYCVIKNIFLTRSLMISIVREGGLTGEVVLQYTISYYPPGSSEALPGVLSEPTGSIVFDQNQSKLKCLFFYYKFCEIKEV